MYSTAHWKRTRATILDRDGHRCQVRGPKCTNQATDVDHIIPVADGGARYDPANLRASCRACNSGRAARQKNRDGWRRSPTRITLVVGPVGAGKTTYVQEHAGPDDLIIDYDLIAQALGPSLSRGVASVRHEAVSRVRGLLLTEVRRGEVSARRVWIVSANPRAEEMFPHHEVIVIDPGREQVLNQHDGTRPISFVTHVDEWYAHRQPLEREW